ncbi:hypothetical protein AMJ47_00565 [Parcubacteria bacterium DG_72]|nr:MAG: hypothetical protein AMJ47_00565 [Parcubacteria bacterium DG_72]
MFDSSLIWFLGLAVFAGAIAIAFYYGGRDDQKNNKKVPLISICIAVIIIFGLSSIFVHYVTIGTIFEKEMLRRLNPPVVSSQQLYGYKIVNMSTSKDESSKTYLISIKDLLKPPILSEPISLEDVEVSEEFFKELEVGDCFLPKIIDPNIPAMDD